MNWLIIYESSKDMLDIDHMSPHVTSSLCHCMDSFANDLNWFTCISNQIVYFKRVNAIINWKYPKTVWTKW